MRSTGGNAPLILNLETRWSMRSASSPSGKEVHVMVHWPGLFEKETNLVLLLRIEPRLLGFQPVAVTIPTELFLF